MTSEITTVAAAVIEYRGRYLLLQRASHKDNAGMWEFPGGKLNAGESLQQCIVRELQEELGVNVEATELLGSARAPAGNKEIILFGVKAVLDREPVQLRDHVEFRWVSPKEFTAYPMTQAEFALLQSLKLAEEKEFTHVNAWSLAKLYGVVNGVFGVFMGMFTFVSTKALPFEVTLGHRALIALTLPFVHILLGFVFGFIAAGFYNFIASIFGGVKMRLK